IDEFQAIDQWDEGNKVKGKSHKQLFRNTINGLTSFMYATAPIFVQTFLSGTAPRAIIEVQEPSKVSFEFVNCPLLSFKSMLEITEHYAEKHGAEKFDCGTYKWMLCPHFLQLLEDTGGLPRAL